jgi:LPXTG-motif cell wall-anchored protein
VPAKALPQSGGISTPALIALGAGALLVGGGLLVRRFVQ